jgi:hypothetical protein
MKLTLYVDEETGKLDKDENKIMETVVDLEVYVSVKTAREIMSYVYKSLILAMPDKDAK